MLKKKESNENRSQVDNSSSIPSGVSIESASYIENNNLEEYENSSSLHEDNEEEHTPKLFSDENSYQSEEGETDISSEENISNQLFDQDLNEEEDFEIPAFLRKQKF